MAQVPIVAGRGKSQTVAAYARVDDDLLLALSVHSWSFDRNGYAKTNVHEGGKKTTRYLHQMVWLFKRGSLPEKPLVIDHRDRDRLNCHSENLRAVTRGVNRTNSSKVKGYHYHKIDRKYVATIRRGDVTIPLGRYDTADEALSAYEQAKAELYPEVN